MNPPNLSSRLRTIFFLIFIQSVEPWPLRDTSMKLGRGCVSVISRSASNRINFREIAPPVDEPVAVGADAAQVARQGSGGGAFRHLPGWDLRRPACDAIDPPRSARLLRLLPALAQEARQLPTEDQDRPPI